MTNTVDDIIKELSDTILKAQMQIEFIQSIEWDKPIDLSMWRKICATQLIYSLDITKLIQNTFPLATNIRIGTYYIYFEMMGFDIQIPTTGSGGINVDTSWYDAGHSVFCITDRDKKSRKKREKMLHEKAAIMINELLPILDAFSTEHNEYDGCYYSLPRKVTISEIKFLENL